MLRSANPALRGNVFAPSRSGYGDDAMTVQGTATKSLLLWCVLAVAAAYTWRLALAGDPMVGGLMGVGGIVGFVVALITTFKKEWSAVTSPIYAACEGLLLGGISSMFEMRFPGIAIQACGLTMAVFLAMMLAYKAGVITATDRFKRGLFAVTGGIAIFYLIEIVLGFFGVHVPMIHESGPIGIAISVGISAVAALNLIIDFDFIEYGARQRAPKYMEWYGAFALMVTLVWLYLELLRLLAKLKSDRS